MTESITGKISALVQKSRKAVKLYSSINKSTGTSKSQLQGLQANEWMEINKNLLEQLKTILNLGSLNGLSAKIISLRDIYNNSWRNSESEIHSLQKELMDASRKGDFIKSTLLSRKLVSLKANKQANQAVHHELNELVKNYNSSNVDDLAEIQEVQEEANYSPTNKVVKLRRII